jgi:hypothetical protein
MILNCIKYLHKCGDRKLQIYDPDAIATKLSLFKSDVNNEIKNEILSMDIQNKSREQSFYVVIYKIIGYYQIKDLTSQLKKVLKATENNPENRVQNWNATLALAKMGSKEEIEKVTKYVDKISLKHRFNSEYYETLVYLSNRTEIIPILIKNIRINKYTDTHQTSVRARGGHKYGSPASTTARIVKGMFKNIPEINCPECPEGIIKIKDWLDTCDKFELIDE